MSRKENISLGTRDLGSEISYIINDMNFKRNRFRDMDVKEIHHKLFSDDPQKPGEYLEFMEEYKASDGRLTPELALEIADIIYYTSQPNCSSSDRKLATKIEEKVGITHQLAQEFCVLKYSHRAYEQKDGDNYKKIERELMVVLLNKKRLGIL